MNSAADFAARPGAGEDAARLFEELVRTDTERLLRLARRLVGDPEEARDVAQEALLRAYGALGDFRGECSLRTWVHRIVVHEALRRLRRKNLRERVLGWLYPRDAGSSPAAPDDPDRHVEAHRMAEALARALDRLPARQRVVLTLRFQEGLSLPEIGDLLGIGPGTVKTHLVRALRQVRRQWRDAGERFDEGT